MDAKRDKNEVTRSSEYPSLSDFEKGFLADQTMLSSVVSADAVLKPSKGVVLEYLEPNPTAAPFLNYSNLLSPLVALSNNILSPGNTLNAGLSSPVEGKSSTPYERVKLQKPIQAELLDLSCIDLTTTHPSWEVSLVKPIVESPKSCLESTWSPINTSAPSEIPLIWPGKLPHPHVSEELPYSLKEIIWLRSEVPSIPQLKDEQHSLSNLVIW